LRVTFCTTCSAIADEQDTVGISPKVNWVRTTERMT
jgi:hypothetical protein